MKKYLVFLLCFVSHLSWSQYDLPVKGLAIAAPDKQNVDRFVKFINEELAPRELNTLILRVDYNFKYKSHPELAEENGLSQMEVNKIVEACQKHGIAIIPQVNLLGHQSWATTVGKLLEVYPEFDETPNVELPEEYVWPNDDGLYCKSYCPLHPEVHAVVFAIVDEIVEAFKANAFHAGMDEVFYIGHEDCPRCQGRDKAELFAGEVTKIRNHLALNGKRLWIWGDRLIDGKTTGIGLWEASYNNTYRAIDMIPKDVMICDWHYERVDPTAVYFAMKGFDVATSPWRKADLAKQQLKLMQDLRANATDEMKEHYKGMVHTVWSPAGSFLNRFYGPFDPEKEDDAVCFKLLFPKE
ncbi:family 20 glycosylhydrolase [Jiulongibacter sediminis]|jgi:N-acetyl-beta-hexosaminidase|uniref:family 20 glycosylhydrolase n=1 Tax=Jiulongibacter sediminis TaxID=1605367 RepID=UPI0026E9CF7C|nr:family 20 glycosylhydrolase [Jiulongibacter sediminis]